MALSTYGYGPELVVQRLHALFVEDVGGGDSRFKDTLETVDTEFEAEWSDGIASTPVPDNANIHKYGIDVKINWGAAQVFIEAADMEYFNQMYNEQPIARVSATVTVAYQARNAEDATFWARRYHATIMRMISANRSFAATATDGIEGIHGIGIPRSVMPFDREEFRGLVIVTIPNIQTQVYGNE